MTTDREITIERLRELKAELLALLEEAHDLVRGTAEERAARSYWVADIRMALDDAHDFMGSGGMTLQDTIDALGVGGDDDEEEDDG